MNPPLALAFLVPHVKLEPGWSVHLEPPRKDPLLVRRPWMRHWALVIETTTIDTRDQHPITVCHGFPVDSPEQNDYLVDEWTRWIFDRVLDVHCHEVREFYTVGSTKPYLPEHGPDGNPYRGLDDLQDR